MGEKSERAQKEEQILQFWKENKVFEKTLEKESPKGEFVFYDGPPFATGLPHYGSLLSSIVKDVIPRYKTMQGFHVRRRWGWDCHGLPIENMVEKELGIKNKKEIEEMGIAKFNKVCRDSVLRFAAEWKVFIDRVGRFVDYDNSYKTMDNNYIESVWWALKEINEKGLLYEGRKVLLYCPHCETPLAKAEIAMDHSYKDITEESVTVEFRVKGKENTSLLAWTTTPWTLPGNVALAVHPDIDYVEIEKKDMGVGKLVRFILAKDRLKANFGEDEYKIVRELKGTDLVGIEYEPLYEISAVKESGKKAWYVAEAAFVTTEEGTGIVHTAVIYGEDDYNLGLKLDLPMVPLLDAAGHFNERSPELIRGQYFKKAEKAVKEDLENRKLIFKREMHTHSYPHCHRCGTALLYNALSSWFINIQKVKGRMIALNEKINWIPDHLKHGRFLNNLENAPDWTISRNRYWASPLPIWKDAAGKATVIGSLEELKKQTKSNGNKFVFLRHGEAEHNVLNICNSDPSKPYHLTELGKKQSQEVASTLDKIDMIYSSPFMRTRETAEIIADALNFDKSKIKTDDRLIDLNFGELDGKPFKEYLDYEDKHVTSYDVKMPGGESYQEAKRRFGEFLYETDSRHKGEIIVVVTHGIGLETAAALIEGADNKRSKEILDTIEAPPGKILEFDFIQLPHNENFELDLHRPYIDEIELVSEDGQQLKRIPEVIDGWVESGSMPFAEYHYPFENKEEFKKSFPGDFIAEYIAQTRTWFYYMHAVAVSLFDEVSFKNVVTTGNILAADGSKMSKSKGNYTDPMINLDRFSADALRYYLMSSVVMQGEDTAFSDEEVRQVQNQVVNILWNSFKFYELYKDTPHEATDSSKHVLDRWILTRLNEVVEAVTGGMEKYDLVTAARPIKDFVSDFSTWYIRRSRERFKGDDMEDKMRALSTTRFVLAELAKLIAPIMPFIAEDIHQKVKSVSSADSVHLALWPHDRKSFIEKLLPTRANSILEEMSKAREAVSLALELRSKANIKVRQPLTKLELKNTLPAEYLDIIKDELNVKEVVVNPNLEREVALDTNLTPELLEEGKVRDAIRAIQEWRKEKNLKPGDQVNYQTSEEFLLKYRSEIENSTNVKLIKN